jgi:2'-5' RNA ligase
MRVFIAIDIPNEIRDRLGAVQEKVRSSTASARWVAPESIHVTLKFIGEMPEKRREDIDQALRGLTWKSIRVKVRGVGFFPGNRSPRVLWAGLEAASMEGLAKEIDSRLEHAGFDRERRAFRPHLTLARAKGSRLDKALVTAATPFTETEFGTFTVNQIYLFESTLKAGGSVYTKLKEYAL